MECRGIPRNTGFPYSPNKNPQEYWNREECNKVYADPEAKKEGYQKEASVVAVALPTKHQPHGERAEEHSHAVDLTLHGREPSRITEEVAQGTHGGGKVGIER